MTPVPAVRLILVRHARPAVVPGAPAPLWELGSDGRRAARALGAAAPPAACLVASDEPKALQTLQEMAGDRPVAAEPGFREVRRPAVWSGSYRALARAYAAGAVPDGWEPQAAVAARLEHAVSGHARIAAAREQNLIVGTHGLALTVWLASRMPAGSRPGRVLGRPAVPRPHRGQPQRPDGSALAGMRSDRVLGS